MSRNQSIWFGLFEGCREAQQIARLPIGHSVNYYDRRQKENLQFFHRLDIGTVEFPVPTVARTKVLESASHESTHLATSTNNKNKGLA